MFADPRVDVGKDGEARMSVTRRRRRDRRRRPLRPRAGGVAARASASARAACRSPRSPAALLFALAGLAALVFGVRSWLRGHCDTRALALVLAIALGASAGSIAVMWPSHRDAVEDDRADRCGRRCSPWRARCWRRARRDGDRVVVKMGEKYEVLATNTLPDQLFIASPVIINGEIFLRGQNTLFCISEKKNSVRARLSSLSKK